MSHRSRLAGFIIDSQQGSLREAAGFWGQALGLAVRDSWWVMEAPTGHRFCVVKMKHPEKGATPHEWT